MAKIEPPYYPIIYVRGYAMTQGEIDATVSTPYMGFNLGSTKVRMNWEGKTVRHVFESPLVRLMKDYGYRDIYHDGKERLGTIPSRSLIIHRYYEAADSELGGGKAPSIQDAAEMLSDLILQVRDQICGDDANARAACRVYLVAHSMGGLVCRCLLQNQSVGADEARAMVDKVYTYATPHNGIELAGLNVPGFLGIWDVNNFNRERIARYLAMGGSRDRVDELDDKFEPDRFFCLVGTNHRDYAAAAGMSRRLAGELSDGLVRIDNASVRGAPRAFVHRSHSGPYGIVNSESGYQNLVRFLFGDLRVDGVLEVEATPLPPIVQKERDRGRDVKASYLFEASIAPRGSVTYKLSERRVERGSAVLRRYDELYDEHGKPRADQRSPKLFSAFLDTSKITRGRTLVFSIELSVSATGYEIDRALFFDQHVEGDYLLRKTVAVQATRAGEGWRVRYTFADDAWAETRGADVKRDDQGLYIPLASKKGFRGRLRLNVREWS
jgi:hypothetical protein